MSSCDDVSHNDLGQPMRRFGDFTGSSPAYGMLAMSPGKATYS